MGSSAMRKNPQNRRQEHFPKRREKNRTERSRPLTAWAKGKCNKRGNPCVLRQGTRGQDPKKGKWQEEQRTKGREVVKYLPLHPEEEGAKKIIRRIGGEGETTTETGGNLNATERGIRKEVCGDSCLLC